MILIHQRHRQTDGQTDGRHAISIPRYALVHRAVKRKEKNRRLTATTSRMRRHVPFEPIDPNICMWGGVADVINCAKFLKIRQKVSELSDPRKIAFPIEIVHRPYSSVGTTVPHCDH